jgi:type IX secretion system PorP/SprF family membrane protein
MAIRPAPYADLFIAEKPRHMSKFYRLLLFPCLLVSGILAAQEVHFSQYNMAPLYLNPAQAGAFLGTARIGGTFRDQWLFLPKDYVTRSFFVDAPIVRGLRKKWGDWVGVGFYFHGDRSGTAGLGQSAGGVINAAYHLAMDKKASQILTIGASFGNFSRSLDRNGLVFEDETAPNLGGGGNPLSEDRTRFQGLSGNNNGGGNPTRDIGNAQAYRSISFGLMYRANLKKKDKLEMGFAVANINQPRYGFSGPRGGGQGSANENDARLPMRITAHGQLERHLTNKISMNPSLLLQLYGPFTEIVPQFTAGYQWDPKIKFNAGLGYRVGDAAILLAGAQMDDFRVGASWDLTTSQLGLRGGFELAANYIIKLYKKPNVPPAILCPRL